MRTSELELLYESADNRFGFTDTHWGSLKSGDERHSSHSLLVYCQRKGNDRSSVGLVEF
jgi:hypothetical protein